MLNHFGNLSYLVPQHYGTLLHQHNLLIYIAVDLQRDTLCN